MALTASALGPSRAPTPSQTRTSSKRKYLIQNKSKATIKKECESAKPKTVTEASETLKANGMNLEDGDPDLYQIANTIMELAIPGTGIPASQAEILRAISLILEKHADDRFETETETQPTQVKAKDEIAEHMQQMDGRMENQENKLNALTEATERIMKMVGTINENTNITQEKTPAIPKPTYAAATQNLIPTRHMDAITRNESKTRQIIVKFQSENIQGLDERMLVTKANLALHECVDHPHNAEFISAKRVHEDTIKYEMNTVVGTLWIKTPINATEFIKKFNVESQIIEGSERLTAEFVPVTFDPTDTVSLREIERKSGLKEKSITGVEWIKAPDRRKPGQKVAFVTIRINNNEDANQAIRGGLIIEGKRVAVNKTQPDPLRCYKCQTYPKPFHFAKDCPHTGKCGTCSAEDTDHTTQTCPVTNPEDQYYAGCDRKGHPSWARNCPTFLEEKRKLLTKARSTNYRFFPTIDDPTTWEELNTAVPPAAPPFPPYAHNELTPTFTQTGTYDPYAYNKNQERRSTTDPRPTAPTRQMGKLPAASTKFAVRNLRRNTTQASQSQAQMRLDGYGYMAQKTRKEPARDERTLSPSASHFTNKNNTDHPTPLPSSFPLPSSPALSISPSRPIRESLYGPT